MKQQRVVLVYNPCSNGLLVHRANDSVENYLQSLLDPLKEEFDFGWKVDPDIPSRSVMT